MTEFKIEKVKCVNCKRIFEVFVAKGRKHLDNICIECDDNQYFAIKNQPRWVSLQKNLLDAHGGKMDPKAEIKMQEYIENEIKRELKNSPTARNWEAGRKKEWKANKKYWKKNGNKF